MNLTDFLFPLLLTTIAGLSTCLGSLVVILVRHPGRRFMAFMFGLAAGVMLLVSFVELLGEAIKDVGLLLASLAFFGGMLVFFAIDALTPHAFIDEQTSKGRPDMHRTGTMVALGVAIHNFPEGLVVFVSALASAELGIVLAVAIAIHNIPEGIAVAAPIYMATGSKLKAFLASFYSGMAEPVGALVGALFLLPFLDGDVMSYVLAGVGGIMVFISLDELLPSAVRLDEDHPIILGVIVGMVIMTASLVLLG